MARVLFLEAFFTGSHKQLIDTLINGFDFEENSYELFTLPGKKWHWRARTSALYFSEVIPKNHSYKVLFTSSVLNLAELIALRPDLRPLHKLLYFHENQLIYPVRKQQERDFQYGYNQIISCIVADIVLFNSHFNLTSFLDSIQAFFKLQPDFRPKGLKEAIMPKSRVLYYPIHIPEVQFNKECAIREMIDHTRLHILWPHRWEHDKGPEIFFSVMNLLIEKGCQFDISVLGEQYSEVPSIFNEFKTKCESLNSNCRIVDWGYVTRGRYIEVLSSAHVVVSTALHEFFGVSMIEAATLGCFPLCPKRLSYPEIFPIECLYKTEAQLVKKLAYFCKNPYATRNFQPDLEKFTWKSLKSTYEELLFNQANVNTLSE